MQPVRWDLLNTLFLMDKLGQFSANDVRFHDHLLHALLCFYGEPKYYEQHSTLSNDTLTEIRYVFEGLASGHSNIKRYHTHQRTQRGMRPSLGSIPTRFPSSSARPNTYLPCWGLPYLLLLSIPVIAQENPRQDHPKRRGQTEFVRYQVNGCWLFSWKRIVAVSGRSFIHLVFIHSGLHQLPF